MTKAVARKKPDLLPVSYVEAKTAVAQCVRVDECKTWADKALALKSYAKQMKDTALEDMAQKIRDRAVRRGGELLLQVKAASGGDRGGGRGNQGVGARPMVSRHAAAEKAGLSPHQAKEMVRVATVPAEKFESMVEARKPATVTKLAQEGTKKIPVKPEPYRAEWLDWTQAIAHLAALPACGLDVLAARRPDAVGDLLREVDEATSNLSVWKGALEKIDVRAKEEA